MKNWRADRRRRLSGLNAVLRAVVKTAINDFGMSVTGFKDGYEGVILNSYRNLDRDSVSGILSLGGTILGTSNQADPFRFPIPQDNGHTYLDRSREFIANFERLGLDALVAIGGDGTMAAAAGLSKLGLNIVGVPRRSIMIYLVQTRHSVRFRRCHSYRRYR